MRRNRSRTHTHSYLTFLQLFPLKKPTRMAMKGKKKPRDWRLIFGISQAD